MAESKLKRYGAATFDRIAIGVIIGGIRNEANTLL